MIESALNVQVDGNHYKTQKIQPITLAYLIGATPCFTKLAKYSTRNKGDRGINLDKAIHCVQLEKELSESSHLLIKNYPALGGMEGIDRASLLIDLFTDDPYIQASLKAMMRMEYDVAINEIVALKRSLDV